jgi:hypothetical protein
VSAEKIGETVSQEFEIRIGGEAVVSSAVSELKDSFEGTLEKMLQADFEFALR